MTAVCARRRKNELLDLFQSSQPRLIQMAGRIIGCQCLAEDVVQDTMLKILESGMDGDVESPVAYLFRMVRNLSIDCARRRRRERGLEDVEAENGEFAAPCPCPDTQMARCQALRLIAAALSELPERTRNAFQMHRIDGVSQRDIASQMRVSPTLVNFMVRDAHNHCRSKLLDHQVDGDLVPALAGRRPNAAASDAGSAVCRKIQRTALERT